MYLPSLVISQTLSTVETALTQPAEKRQVARIKPQALTRNHYYTVEPPLTATPE